MQVGFTSAQRLLKHVVRYLPGIRPEFQNIARTTAKAVEAL